MLGGNERHIIFSCSTNIYSFHFEIKSKQKIYFFGLILSKIDELLLKKKILLTISKSIGDINVCLFYMIFVDQTNEMKEGVY